MNYLNNIIHYKMGCMCSSEFENLIMKYYQDEDAVNKIGAYLDKHPIYLATRSIVSWGDCNSTGKTVGNFYRVKKIIDKNNEYYYYLYDYMIDLYYVQDYVYANNLPLWKLLVSKIPDYHIKFLHHSDHAYIIDHLSAVKQRLVPLYQPTRSDQNIIVSQEEGV